jgi:GxxExxY protein
LKCTIISGTVFSTAFTSARSKSNFYGEPSKAELERRITVRYKDAIVGEYDADLIVDGSVLVEIKIAPQYDKRDEAQLLNMLKATGIKVGVLVNFGRYKVEYKRLIF